MKFLLIKLRMSLFGTYFAWVSCLPDFHIPWTLRLTSQWAESRRYKAKGFHLVFLGTVLKRILCAHETFILQTLSSNSHVLKDIDIGADTCSISTVRMNNYFPAVVNGSGAETVHEIICFGIEPKELRQDKIFYESSCSRIDIKIYWKPKSILRMIADRLQVCSKGWRSLLFGLQHNYGSW